MINWYDIGYKKAMQLETGALTSMEDYPTRDKHSAEEENDFINGFLDGKKESSTKGYQTCPAYMEESHNGNRTNL